MLGRLRNGFVALAAAGAAAVSVVLNPLVPQEAAHADSADRVTVGMPFDGQWAWNADIAPPYSDETSSHPSVHSTPGGGDWATDLYAAAEGKQVKLRAKAAAGQLSFSWGSSSTSCGESVKINTLVDGRNVGSIYIAHLSDAVTSGAITDGMTLGTVKTITKDGKVCNPGRHVHVEFKNSADYACYADHGHPGASLHEGDDLGVIGSGNKHAKQPCSTAAEDVSVARPAAITFNGALNVFIRGGDGQIYNQYWNGANWTGYAGIGGNMKSDPAVIVHNGALNVFAIGEDGQMYTKYSDGSGWSGWSSMGPVTMKGQPRVVQYGSEVDVIALGTDGQVYKNNWNGSRWGGFSSLGGSMDSSPAALQYGSELTVVARAKDNTIRKDTWNGNSWGGFNSLGGSLAGDPDAVTYGRQYDVWAISAGGGLWKRTWNGSTWGGWAWMGDGFRGTPDAMQYNGDLEVFARAADNHVYTRYWGATSKSWSAWGDLGGAIAGEPTAIQYGKELSVFAVGNDGKTYKNTFFPETGWGTFTALPG